MDQIESLYLTGYKHLMMLYPDHVKRMPGFHYDYNSLPNAVIQQECEQYTLKKLRFVLDRSGADYPAELPQLIASSSAQQSKDWLSAHNYDSDKAVKIYDAHKGSMSGDNPGRHVNPEQLHILKTIEDEIRQYAEDPDAYEGFVGMLDAPGGTGNFFSLRVGVWG